MSFKKIIPELANAHIETMCESLHDYFVDYKVDSLIEVDMDTYTIVLARIGDECLIVAVTDDNGEHVRLEASELLTLKSICNEKINDKYN